ncbi:MAG: caspase family protein [Saprospiraceae bacterium]|nr:caspase family protein [Saprospiraceae bacterium]
MSEKKGLARPPQYGEQNTAPKGKNYLFAVGINDYVYCPKLKNAVKDVKDFIALVTTKYQFDEENITTLFNAKATSGNILNGLRDLAQKVGSTDNLIIYFSGHGSYDKIFKQGYWIPVNGKQGAFDTFLPNSTVRDALSAIASHHTFLIADSCFSGTLFTGRDANSDIASRLERDASRWGLTAGRNEIVDDGQAGTNSPFAAKLLDVLQKNEKPLGVAELCAKMMEIVTANADQTPRGEPLRINGHDGGQFFFHPKNEAITIKTTEKPTKTTTETPPKRGTKTPVVLPTLPPVPEKDNEHWRINKINVGVGVVLVIIFVGVLLLNHYVLQPLLNKGEEKLNQVLTDNAQTNIPSVVKFSDPFDDKMTLIQGAIAPISVGASQKPALNVALPDFWVNKNEVTQHDWKKVTADLPLQPKYCEDCLVLIDTPQIRNFLALLNEKSDKKYRLMSGLEKSYLKRNGIITTETQRGFRIAKNK